MSAFTPWNGPQNSSGPNTKDVIALVDAYNNLLTKLNNHLEAVAPTDSTVHGVVSFVNSVRTALESTIATKAGNTELNDVRMVANAAATKQELNDAVANMNELIANKASISDLGVKADITTLNGVSSRLATVEGLLTQLTNEFNALANHITDTDVQLALDCAIKTATYLLGKIKAFEIIDFTKWAHFTAPFAGTGSLSDTSTNGAFILGCLSTNWGDDKNIPNETYSHKASRAYIKYVNTTPFDAICDMVVTRSVDGEFTGSLTVHLAKKAGTWKDMAFHLISGTNSSGKEVVYLAVSSAGLSSASSDYSNTNFRAVGINFIPVGVDGYTSPTGMLHGVTTATVGTNASSITSIDNIRLEQVWSPNYFDGEGYNLIRVVSKEDPDNEGEMFRQVFIGDAEHDEITFIKRPSMIVTTENDEQVKVYFVTARDITNVSMPVGAIVRWALVDENDNLKNVPAGYLACDGSQISITDYPDLCELLGMDEFGMATLPNETHSIIKAIFYDIIDKSSQPDYDELVEFSMLNKKIDKETDRAKTTEEALATRIDVNTEDIASNTEAIANEVERATSAEQAETERATAAEAALSDEIDAVDTKLDNNLASIDGRLIEEQQRAEAAEQQNATNIESLDTRLTAAEQDIDDEVARATAKETELDEKIAAETARATEAENTNAAAIATETSRAIEAETTLNKRVDHYEVLENRLQANIDAETQRAIAAETNLQQNINTEIARATGAETQLQTNIDTEKSRAEAAEQALDTKITEETTRATDAEQALDTKITEETTRATDAEAQLQTNITAEETRATTKEGALEAAIEAETERATQAEQQEATTRSDQDTELTRAIADETSRASQAEQDLSDRIDQLHPNG